MRNLVISDVHANITALEAVLTDAGDVDSILCLGDLVGYGPDPNEVIERLQNVSSLKCLLGNHDAATLGKINLGAFNEEAKQNIEWAQKIISPSNFHFLQNLSDRIITDNITMVHGSPRNPIWEYLLDTYTVMINFEYFETQYCLVGHTHIPMIYYQSEQNSEPEWRSTHDGELIHLTGRMILNPGSIGQPRDRDPRAAYAIFDTDQNTWESKRVQYDIEGVQKRILLSSLPRRHALRLSEGW